MRKIFFVFALLLAACSGKNLDEIKPGMTEKEVKEIMGKPNKAESSSQHFDNPDGTSVTLKHGFWVYEGLGYISFDNGKVSEVVKDKK